MASTPWGSKNPIIGSDPFLAWDGVKFEDLKLNSESLQQIDPTRRHCEGTIKGIPVSVRIVRRSANMTVVNESASFLRRKHDKDYPLVLQPMYRLSGGQDFYYVYHHFQYNLKAYVEKIKADPALFTTKLMRVMRGVFCALQDLHYRKKENHGNLNSEWCVVINEEPVFMVMLTGLGGSREGEKKSECSSLRDLFYNVIEDENPLWFRSMMETLSDPYQNSKLWNLHNNILFLGARQRLVYLSEAGKAVEDVRARPFKNKYFDGDTSNHKWVDIVNEDPEYSSFFRKILYHGQGTYTEEQYYNIVLCDKKNPRGFFWFCRNYASHNHENLMKLSLDYQWELLYRLWPEFFDRLHQMLVDGGIYVFKY